MSLSAQAGAGDDKPQSRVEGHMEWVRMVDRDASVRALLVDHLGLAASRAWPSREQWGLPRLSVPEDSIARLTCVQTTRSPAGGVSSSVTDQGMG